MKKEHIRITKFESGVAKDVVIPVETNDSQFLLEIARRLEEVLNKDKATHYDYIVDSY